jgi:hypothetical protein
MALGQSHVLVEIVPLRQLGAVERERLHGGLHRLEQRPRTTLQDWCAQGRTLDEAGEELVHARTMST